MSRLIVAGALVVASVFAPACGSGRDTEAADTHEEVVHVHDLLVRGDDTVLAATHLGLYRVADGGLDPIGAGRHDLMATALDGDTILASGHPDLRDDTLRVEDRPPLLGIVESIDGETWMERSLLGDADFHRLVFADGQLFGANSSDDAVWVSPDGGATWEPRGGAAQLVAMAVNPADPSELVGVDLDRGFVRSGDGGDSWTDAQGPELADVEWTGHGIIGHDEEGAVYRFDGETWTPIGDLADVAALGTRGDELFALQLPSTVLRSTDGGATWTEFP